MNETHVIAHNPEMLGMVDLKPDIEFACPDGERLALQLLKPMWKSPEGKGFPLVVFIQGSAWQKPNQFWQLPQLSLLSRRGFVIASVTHRACWTAKAPAFLQDVKSAIRFLRAHAEEYDIDKERVCAWGTSSGGNTALLLGLTGDDPAFETELWAGQSTRVQAVVDCFGPSNLVYMLTKERRHEGPEGVALFTALAGCKLVGEDGEPTPEGIAALKMISPEYYVEKGRNLPPFLLLHGDADPVVLYSDSDRMHEKLTSCGYESQLVKVTDAPHEGPFWSMELLEIIFAFIQEKIG